MTIAAEREVTVVDGDGGVSTESVDLEAMSSKLAVSKLGSE